MKDLRPYARFCAMTILAGALLAIPSVVRVTDGRAIAQNADPRPQSPRGAAEKSIAQRFDRGEANSFTGKESSSARSQDGPARQIAQAGEEERKETAAPAGPKRLPKVTGQKSILLNFNNVEISEFLNVMSQIAGKNIIMDDKVRGKISISSSRKVPVSRAIDIMKAILEVKGLAVVETEMLIKVVPIQDAVKQTIKVVIDKKGEKTLAGEDIVTYLYQFRNAELNEVGKVFNSLKSRNTDVVMYQPDNMVILRGPGSEINGLITLARTFDEAYDDGKAGDEKKEKQPRGRINVIHLEHADATDLANVLSRVPFSETAKIDTSPVEQPAAQPVKTPKTKGKTQQMTATQPGAKDSKAKLSIIANKETNSLIVTANPEEYNEIRRIVQELDIVREQVYIESLIVEVSAQSGWGFGIDWMLGNQTGSHLYGGSSIMGSVPDYTVPSSLSGKSLAVPLSTGFQLGYLSDRSVLGYVLLNASGTDSNFNVLSTPQVLAIDNNESEINVGSDVPVVSNNRISDTGTQFYTYEYKTVGVKFKVKPHITKKQAITLDLTLEVNSVTSEAQVVGNQVIPPTLGRRDFKTKVTVNDGKTIVVGGLIRDEKSVTETRVPWLGDIPLLGWFFKHKSVSDTKTNLLVFITPYIVTRQMKIDSLTGQKREEQRRLKLRSR